MSDKPKTVAEAAYCELLAMPMPRTLLDFKHALILAVLVGRQLEADLQQPTSQTAGKPIP